MEDFLQRLRWRTLVSSQKKRPKIALRRITKRPKKKGRVCSGVFDLLPVKSDPSSLPSLRPTTTPRPTECSRENKMDPEREKEREAGEGEVNWGME